MKNRRFKGSAPLKQQNCQHQKYIFDTAVLANKKINFRRRGWADLKDFLITAYLISLSLI